MDCQTLISEVQSRKQLWDMSHPQHHNRGVLDRLWREISKIMNIPVKQIRQKWKYLRDQFRREFKRIPITGSGDEEEHSYEPTWPYYHLLLFLKDQMIPKDMSENVSSYSPDLKTTTVLRDPQEYNEYSEEEEEESKLSFDLDNKYTPVTLEQQPTKSMTLKRSNTSTNAMNAKQLKLEQTSNQEEKCDDYHFFMSLIPAMKKFTQFQKIKIRTKFQQIILEEMSNSLNVESGSST